MDEPLVEQTDGETEHGRSEAAFERGGSNRGQDPALNQSLEPRRLREEGRRALRMSEHRAKTSKLEVEESAFEQIGHVRVRALDEQVAAGPEAQRPKFVVIEVRCAIDRNLPAALEGKRDPLIIQSCL